MIDDEEIDEEDIAYSSEYDAHYNKKTNEWIDHKCCDLTCDFCNNRPERPLKEQS